MNFKKTVAIVAAAGALTALAIPALAETNFYGSVRLLTFVDFNENGAAGKTTKYDQPLAAPSRFGVNVVNGALASRIEMGILGGNVAPGSTEALIYTRLAYGTYKFDVGTLLVGQDYNKYWNPSARVFAGDDPSNGFGALYDGRQPNLRFTLNNGVYFGFIKPVSGASSDAVMPKVNAGYEGVAGPAKFGAGAMFQTYKDTTVGVNKNINTYLVYGKAGVTLGAAELRGNIGYGQNLGDSGFTNTTTTGAHQVVAGSLENSNTLSGYVQGSFTVSPTLKANAIAGYTSNDNSTYAHADNMMSLTLNSNVTIAKNFIITPEVTYIDNLKDKNGVTEKKRDTFVGARWQLDF